MPDNNRLNKLFGRRSPLPKTVEDALGQLGTLAERQPDLAAVAATTASLLRVMYDDVPTILFPWSQEQVAITAEGGVPLLRAEHLVLPGDKLRGRFQRLCAAMVEQSHPTGAPLLAAAKGGSFHITELVDEVLHGDPGTVAGRAADLGLDADLAATLLRLTLLPLLEQVSNVAAPLRPDNVWTAGYCPTCGSWPLLGEYRGLETTRYLRCGLCADEWQIDRMLCFVCGTRAHYDLHYLEVPEERLKQRIYACDRCHCYIKQISTLSRLDVPSLLVTDISTLHLDLVALEHNFSGPQ